MSVIEPPATCAVKVAVALVECALKASVSMSAICRKDFSHLAMVAEPTGLTGLQ